jgi:hypothetical protein
LLLSPREQIARAVSGIVLSEACEMKASRAPGVRTGALKQILLGDSEMRSLTRPAAMMMALMGAFAVTVSTAAPASAESAEKGGIVLRVPAIALGEIISDNSLHSRVIVIESVAGDAGKKTEESATEATDDKAPEADGEKLEATVSIVRIIPNQGTLNRPGPVFCYLPRLWLEGIRIMNSSFKTEILLMPEDVEDTGAIRPSYATVAVDQWGG